jgi:hypothetical protein
MAMFHMSNDSGLFRTYADLERLGGKLAQMTWTLPNKSRFVPLCEPKMFDFYNHRAASYASRGEQRGYRVLPDTTEDERADLSFQVQPFYWVAEEEVNERLGVETRAWLFGFKDITSPTNERTFVCTIVPRGGLSNKMPLILVSDLRLPIPCALVANLSSLPFDYVARQKIGGVTLNYFIVKQLPVLPPSDYTRDDLQFISERVLELSYTAWDLQPFARELGYEGPPFAWDEDRRAQLRAELDAWYAHAYGLSRDELRYILDPTDVKGPDYPSETFRVLKKNEVARFGEYRTARLVLVAYDQLTKHPLAAE